MTNRRFTLLSFAAVALMAVLRPAAANAQDSIWGRIRDRAEQERDRDNRRNRDDDRYGRRNGRISDNERRTLRDAARRISDRSRDLQRDIDRLLDNSRYNGSRREDDINGEARTFRGISNPLKYVAGDSNNPYRTPTQAPQLLDQTSRPGPMLAR